MYGATVPLAEEEQLQIIPAPKSQPRTSVRNLVFLIGVIGVFGISAAVLLRHEKSSPRSNLKQTFSSNFIEYPFSPTELVESSPVYLTPTKVDSFPVSESKSPPNPSSPILEEQNQPSSLVEENGISDGQFRTNGLAENTATEAEPVITSSLSDFVGTQEDLAETKESVISNAAAHLLINDGLVSDTTKFSIPPQQPVDRGSDAIISTSQDNVNILSSHNSASSFPSPEIVSPLGTTSDPISVVSAASSAIDSQPVLNPRDEISFSSVASGIPTPALPHEQGTSMQASAPEADALEVTESTSSSPESLNTPSTQSLVRPSPYSTEEGVPSISTVSFTSPAFESQPVQEPFSGVASDVSSSMLAKSLKTSAQTVVQGSDAVDVAATTSISSAKADIPSIQTFSSYIPSSTDGGPGFRTPSDPIPAIPLSSQATKSQPITRTSLSAEAVDVSSSPLFQRQEAPVQAFVQGSDAADLTATIPILTKSEIFEDDTVNHEQSGIQYTKEEKPSVQNVVSNDDGMSQGPPFSNAAKGFSTPDVAEILNRDQILSVSPEQEHKSFESANQGVDGSASDPVGGIIQSGQIRVDAVPYPNSQESKSLDSLFAGSLTPASSTNHEEVKSVEPVASDDDSDTFAPEITKTFIKSEVEGTTFPENMKTDIQEESVGSKTTGTAALPTNEIEESVQNSPEEKPASDKPHRVISCDALGCTQMSKKFFLDDTKQLKNLVKDRAEASEQIEQREPQEKGKGRVEENSQLANIPTAFNFKDLVGDYEDPNHPGMPRSVTLDEKYNLFAEGSDDGVTFWRLPITNSHGVLLIDFLPKGGPADLEGTWDGSGIAFPDGNVWSKIVGEQSVEKPLEQKITNIGGSDTLDSIILGTYLDPMHPGMSRTIFADESSNLFAKGSDDGELFWTLPIMINDEDILIDFSQKGGPKDLIGKWDGTGIVFPDGNKWIKIVKTPDAEASGDDGELSLDFLGEYNDHAHLEMPRSLVMEQGQIFAEGSDDGMSYWKLPVKRLSSGDFLFDFSPKGGPSDMVGSWDGKGIRFPDGNKWTLKGISQSISQSVDSQEKTHLDELVAQNSVDGLNSESVEQHSALAREIADDLLAYVDLDAFNGQVEPLNWISDSVTAVAVPSDDKKDEISGTSTLSDQQETGIPIERWDEKDQKESEEQPASFKELEAAVPEQMGVSDEIAAVVSEHVMAAQDADNSESSNELDSFSSEEAKTYTENEDEVQLDIMIETSELDEVVPEVMVHTTGSTELEEKMEEDEVAQVSITETENNLPSGGLITGEVDPVVNAGSSELDTVNSEEDDEVTEGAVTDVEESVTFTAATDDSEYDEPEKIVTDSSSNEEDEVDPEDHTDPFAGPNQKGGKSKPEDGKAKKNKIDKSCTKVDTGIPEPKDVGNRFPPSFKKITLNLWDHHEVQRAWPGFSDEAVEKCVTQDNIDFFINEDLIKNDLMETEGLSAYTVFNLDCRDEAGKSLLAFIVVLNDSGEVSAVKPIKKRAESVNMKDTDTVLFVSVGEAGGFEWKWRDGSQQKLPFYSDSHTLWYSSKRDQYFGMEMASQTQKNSPSVASIYDSDGNEVFQYFQDGSHINYITAGEDAMYLSLRSSASLQKVNIETQQIEWTLGGTTSDFTIVDIDGNVYVPDNSDTWRDNFGSWHHQHKFQHLDDLHFSLFDNHVNEEKTFIDDATSRMVILEIDEEKSVAKEIFAFDTGDQSMIYGGADILPSGNVLGSSYPDYVYPEIDDQSYQQNIWEATPHGEVAWRVGIKGPNPWAPADLTSVFSHRIDICEEAPVGWVIFNVERFYEKPLLATPCVDGSSLRFLAFNTIRTQDDQTGIAILYDKTTGEPVGKQLVSFQKSWLPKSTEIEVPEDAQDHDLALVLVNSWKDSGTYLLGKFDELQQCDDVYQGRIITGS